MEFTKENECPDNFQSLSKHCVILVHGRTFSSIMMDLNPWQILLNNIIH